MLIWIIAIALVTFSLWIYLSPPDIDPYFIQHQASFAHTRLHNETAVARSTINPHGTPLTASKFQFNLRDLWDEKWSVQVVEGPILKTSTVDMCELVQEYLPSLRALAMNGSKVLCAVPQGPKALGLLFACTLSGLTLYFTLPSDIEAAIDKVRPGTIIVDSRTSLADIDLKDAIPVCVDDNSKEVMPLTSFRMGNSPPPSPKPEQSVFGVFDGTTLSTFTHNDIGRAIAAQLVSLHKEDRWSSKDLVLNFGLYPNAYNLLMTLVCISSKSKLVFMDHSFTEPFTTIEYIKPSILFTDDLSVRSLCRKTDDFRLLGYALLNFRYLLQKKGRLWSALLSELDSLRLVYTSSVWQERHGALTAQEIRTARALLGAQVIHALCIPGYLSPIAQTTLGDYRFTDKLINFGPPVSGLELKVVHTTPKAPKYGTLSVNFGTYWEETGHECHLQNDGCLYFNAPEPDEIDMYTEHLRPVETES